jgi:hypothetical protein
LEPHASGANVKRDEAVRGTEIAPLFDELWRRKVMHQEETTLAGGGRAKRITQRTHDLIRSRANLSHLIYSMEHDRTLGAAESKIDSLRRLLSGIERQIIVGHHASHQARP